MISQSPNVYSSLVQSLTSEQIQQIVEAIATEHSAELLSACEQRLHTPPLPPIITAEEVLKNQVKALQHEVIAERTRRQAAEQEALLWKQKFAKTVNYLRRHI